MDTRQGSVKAANAPLAPFEEYMYRDDSVRYPMSLFLRLHLSGTIETATFERACQLAADRHSRLVSTVHETDGKLAWVPARNPNPEFIVASSAAADEQEDLDESFPSLGHLDLQARPGLRILFTPASTAEESDAGASSNVVFQFHHSCCDGMGAIDYLKDVLVHYGQLTNASSVATFVNTSRPAPRALSVTLRELGYALAVRIPNLFFGALRLRDFLSLTPRVVARPQTEAVTGAHVVSRMLSHAESAAYFQGAKKQGVTVNDMLIRDLFLALDAHFPSGARGNVRVLTPINLRRGMQQPEASNLVGMIFVDRNEKQQRSPKLLQGISQEMQRVKRWRLGETSLRALRFARIMPGGMIRFLKLRDCWATAVLSNLGRPFARKGSLDTDDAGRIIVGKLVLDRLDFVPPIRDKTNVAVGVATYAGRLHIALQYDQSCLTQSEASSLLEAIVARAADTPQAIDVSEVEPIEALR